MEQDQEDPFPTKTVLPTIESVVCLLSECHHRLYCDTWPKRLLYINILVGDILRIWTSRVSLLVLIDHTRSNDRESSLVSS